MKSNLERDNPTKSTEILSNDYDEFERDSTLKKENEDLNSESQLKRDDSLKFHYSDDIEKEIEDFKEKYYKEMEEEIIKQKQFHMNEIQSFESKF